MSAAASDAIEPPATKMSQSAMVSNDVATTAVTAATGFVDDRVLPQLPQAGYFALLPGETRVFEIEAAAQALVDPLFVRLDAWNAAQLDVQVDMTPPQ